MGDEQKEINLDLARSERTGLAEAVFCEGKSESQLLEICSQLTESQNAMLFTRLSEDAANAIRESWPDKLDYDRMAILTTGLDRAFRAFFESQTFSADRG